MHIILEGPDNSGKSTLAAYLSTELGIEVHHSGGPSKRTGEINQRTDDYNAIEETMIFDRYPAISQNIYADALLDNRERVSTERVIAFYALRPFIVYCRNIRGTEGHEISEHSGGEDHFHQVNANMERLCQLYDRWAPNYAHAVYRIGDDMNAVAGAIRSAIGESPQVCDLWRDIIAFHQKFGLEYTGKPRMLPEELSEFRAKFLQEELNEYTTAIQDADGVLHEVPLDEAEFVHQLETQADSLIDLVYVAMGNAYLQGFDFPEMWRRVQAANMRKVRAQRFSDSLRGSTFDVVKPKGWMPPKHTDLLEDHAHRDQFRT